MASDTTTTPVLNATAQPLGQCCRHSGNKAVPAELVDDRLVGVTEEE